MCKCCAGPLPGPQRSVQAEPDQLMDAKKLMEEKDRALKDSQKEIDALKAALSQATEQLAVKAERAEASEKAAVVDEWRLVRKTAAGRCDREAFVESMLTKHKDKLSPGARVRARVRA